MRRRFWLMTAAVLTAGAGVFGGVAAAAEGDGFGSSSWQACWDESANRLEASACLELAHERVESALKITENAAAGQSALFDDLTGRTRAGEMFAQSDLSFRAYRLAACGHQRELVGSGTGTHMVWLDCMIRLAQERIRLIQE